VLAWAAVREGMGWDERSAGVIAGRSAHESSGVAKRGTGAVEPWRRTVESWGGTDVPWAGTAKSGA
jgi:hypothetical protein